jgi:integrase
MNTGFDRGLNYLEIKNDLIKDLDDQIKKFKTSGFVKRSSKNIIFLLILLVQLRNGSRISEAIDAFGKFYKEGVEKKVIIKISKSESLKKKWVLSKDGKKKVLEYFKTKPRYRQIMFPSLWIKNKNIKSIINDVMNINNDILKKETLKKDICKYMERHHKSNTHSLRYAFINYLIYTEKRPISDVAKFVGHSNINQMITYTQQINCNKIFDLNI